VVLICISFMARDGADSQGSEGQCATASLAAKKEKAYLSNKCAYFCLVKLIVRNVQKN
jgi:hypothetical protein